VGVAVVVGASALNGLLVDRFHCRQARRLARARGDEEAALEGVRSSPACRRGLPGPTGSRRRAVEDRAPRAAARSGGEARHA
jgi:hypothetical protein